MFYKENPANNRNQIDFYILDKLVLLMFLGLRSRSKTSRALISIPPITSF